MSQKWIDAITQQVSDARAFGLGCLMRHVKRPDTDGYVKVNTSAGTILIRRRNSDFKVFRQIFAGCEYDIDSHLPGPGLRDVYDTRVRQGRQPVVIDCGANAGFSALYFAKSFPAAKVIALEPDAENYALLVRNTAGVANILPVNAAVGCEEGSVTLNKIAGHAWGTTTTRIAGQGVAVRTINALAAEVGGDLLLVKIDIEGFEADLFSCNTEWIKRAAALIVEPHDWIYPGSSHTMQRALMGCGMDMLIIGENLAWVSGEAAGVRAETVA